MLRPAWPSRGCAHNPAPAHPTAEALYTSPAAPGAACGRDSRHPDRCRRPKPRRRRTTRSWNRSSRRFNDHSFVSPIPSDLFIRLRAGFKLDDVDQPPSIASSTGTRTIPTISSGPGHAPTITCYYIVEQLDARSMPLELALLPVVESAFEPYAYSRARASGLWQFIPGTGSTSA